MGRCALATIAVAALVAAWLLDALRLGWPVGVDRALIALAAAAGCWAAARPLRRAWDRLEPGERRAVAVVLGLGALATAIRLAGIDWELGGGSLRDESYYLKLARRVNDGGLLPQAFHYGHLVYYLGAFTLWLGNTLPLLRDAFAALVADPGLTPNELDWLVTRGLVAILGGLTVVVVGVAAGRLAGPSGAIAGAAILACSPLHARISRQLIAETPSAFFAACAFAVAVALLPPREDLVARRGEWRGWALAGCAAALAAACKYPAGLVAAAIVAVWATRVVVDRRWSWGLLIAGGAAILTLFAVMPALLVYPGEALSGEGKDLLFGARQYAKGGWLGVQPESLGGWYARRIVTDLGWPLVALGLAGLAALPRGGRVSILAVVAWPATYFALLASMSMAVERTLTPLIPAVAVLLGAGIGILLERAGSVRWPAGRNVVGPAVAGLVALALVVPARTTLLEVGALLRPSTRELAAAWIEAHAAPGARIFVESYGPRLDRDRYAVSTDRFAGRLPLEELGSAYDLVVLADSSYARFFQHELEQRHHRAIRRRYERLLALEPAFAVDADDGRHRGPRIVVIDREQLRSLRGPAAAAQAPPGESSTPPAEPPGDIARAED